MKPSGSLTRQLLKQHGFIKPQLYEQWAGLIPLPEQIRDFYLNVGPINIDIDLGIGHACIPSLSELWQYQSGYRWNSIDGHPIAGWAPEWLVVSSIDGDPFIFSSHDNWVHFSRHGSGEWKPLPIFPDLNSMSCCLSVLGLIAKNEDSNLLDSNHSIRTEVQKKALDELSAVLGNEEAAMNVLSILEWH